MLLVMGVLAASLAGMQEEAQADPMVSSWYGPGFEGAVTASGDVYDYGDYTAASPYYPIGTELQVCYEACTVVTVNDLGPYVAGRDLDPSQAAETSASPTRAPTSSTWRSSGTKRYPCEALFRGRARRL